MQGKMSTASRRVVKKKLKGPEANGHQKKVI
jgi:hypothetical protein